MTTPLQEAVDNLRNYRSKHLDFPERLARARRALALAESELDQAKKALAEAETVATADALMDETLTNDAKRKAAVSKALQGDLVVKSAREHLRLSQLKVANMAAEVETVRDQRRAVEHAQAAAVAIVEAFAVDVDG